MQNLVASVRKNKLLKENLVNSFHINRNLLFLAILAFLFNIGLVMNPGYFSHDELGWGYKTFERSLSDIPWYNILEYKEFHYRPLNFNLWLFLSYYFFDTPQLFHLVLLTLGLVNSYLLYLILREEINHKTSLAAFFVSMIFPSTCFVNGWIGTIADIMWLQLCLISVLLFQKARKSNNKKALAVSLLTYSTSLLFKETAVVFPGIIFLYIYYKNYGIAPPKIKKIPSTDIILFLFSTTIVLAYLLLRLEYLFPSKGGYGSSFANIPIRSAEYFTYPFLVTAMEIYGIWQQKSNLALGLSIALNTLLLFSSCGRDPYKICFYILCYFVSIVPMLILDSGAPHYMYGTGFFLAIVLSHHIVSTGIKKKIGLILTAFLLAHTAFIQITYFDYGRMQSNFFASAYGILKSNQSNNLECEYHIHPEIGAKSWVIVRATAFRDKIFDIRLANQITVHSPFDKIVSNSKTCNLILKRNGIVYKTTQ